MKTKKHIVLGLTSFTLLTSLALTSTLVNNDVVFAEDKASNTNLNDKDKDFVAKLEKEIAAKAAKEKAEK